MLFYGGILGYFVTAGSIIKKNSKLFLLLMLSILAILTGGRSYYIGKDTIHYVSFFQSMVRSKQMDDLSLDTLINSRFEWGFQLFNKIVATVTTDARWILVISAIFLYSVIYWYIVKNSNNYLTSTIVFFFIYFGLGMSITRQMIAVPILIIAYQMLKENKAILFFLLVFLAFLFHRSSVIFIVVYFMRNKSFSLKNAVTISGIGGIIAIFFNQIFNFFITYTAAYQYYEEGVEEASGPKLATVALIAFCIIFLIIGINLKNRTESKRIDLDLYTMTFGLTMYLISLGFTGFDRTALAFQFPAIIVVANGLNSVINDRYRRFVTCLLYEALLAYFFIGQWLRPDWNGILPYHWGL